MSKFVSEHERELPERGRLLGIDYGTKRVGVAVTDVFQEIASPLYNYQRVSHTADVHFFQKLTTEYQAAGLVIGLPLHVSGEESEKSQESRRYADWLSRVMDLPHAFQDERYSSVTAESWLMEAEFTKKQRKARVDKLAAHIFLQEFIQQRAAARHRAVHLVRVRGCGTRGVKARALSPLRLHPQRQPARAQWTRSGQR